MKGNLSNAISGLIGAVLSAVVILLMWDGGSTRFIADTSMLLFPVDIGSWYPNVHISSNAFHMWRLDPLLSLLTSRFDFGVYVALCIAVFCSGLVVFLADLLPRVSVWLRALLSFGIAISVPALVGLDPVVIGSLLWLPFHLWAARRVVLNANPSFLQLATLLLLGMVICVDANQLSPIILGLSFLYVVYSTQDHTQAAPCRSRDWVIGLSFALALFSAFSAPIPFFSNYPKFAHTVPGYGTLVGLRPMLGPEPPLLLIDRAFIRGIFFWPALIMAVLSVVPFVRRIIFLHQHDMQATNAVFAFAIALLLLLDTEIIPAKLSQIAPIATLGRIIPGLFFFSLAPLFLALGVVFLLMALCAHKAYSVKIVAIVVGVCGIAFYQGEFVTARIGACAPIRGSTEENQKYILSPSYALLREYGLKILDRKSDFERVKFKAPQNLNAVISASHKLGEVKLMSDGNQKTRWYSGSGKQKGDEWIYLEFNNLYPITGLKLDVGAFEGDFPRGLAIFADSVCESDPMKQRWQNPIFETKDFQGEIGFTEDGYPFYYAQSRVAWRANKPVNVSCLFIRQIGKSDHFDWSVTELAVGISDD